MIVPAMTTEEVRQEILHDFESVWRKVMAHYKVMYQEMTRKHINNAVHTVKYKSARKTEWTLLYRLKNGQPQNTFYTEAVDKRGKVAYQFSRSANEWDAGIIKYNPHFFRRYRERVHPHITVPAEVIRHFFKHNFECVAGQTELLPDNTTLMNYVFQEGIGIGWHSPLKKIVHMKTFLPHEMLNQKQKSLVDYIRHHEDGEEFIWHIKPEHHQRKI
jgi:hypothetical protein